MHRRSTLPRRDARRLLLALMALALLLRWGVGCEAMAATHPVGSAVAAHCDRMPAPPGKAMKADVAGCALCHTMPDTRIAHGDRAGCAAAAPVAAIARGLDGLSRGPAPPPPQIG